MFKYKIDEFLENLPARQNRRLVNQIPEILNISYNTFRNYCRIPLRSKKDIPYESIRKLEILFGMESGELANYTPTGVHYLEVIKREPVKRGRRTPVPEDTEIIYEDDELFFEE